MRDAEQQCQVHKHEYALYNGSSGSARKLQDLSFHYSTDEPDVCQIRTQMLNDFDMFLQDDDEKR